MDHGGTAPAKILDELRRNFFKKPRRNAHLRHVVAIAAAIVRAREDQRVHGARHAHVAETALLFEFVGIGERARMREQALLKPGEKDQRKLQALGRVQRHQRDARIGIELVGVRSQRRMIEKLGQSLAALFGIVRGVGQFLQVLNAAEGLRRALGLKRLDVAGAVDEKANQLGQSGGIAGRTKSGSSRFLASSAGLSA